MREREEGGWTKWVVGFLLATPPPLNLAWYWVLRRRYGRPPPIPYLSEFEEQVRTLGPRERQQLELMTYATPNRRRRRRRRVRW
jgi:hypothetical protein